MDDWWARRRNVLNLIKYMRKKSQNTLQRLYTQLSFLDQLCSGNSKAMEEVGKNTANKTVINFLQGIVQWNQTDVCELTIKLLVANFLYSVCLVCHSL